MRKWRKGEKEKNKGKGEKGNRRKRKKGKKHSDTLGQYKASKNPYNKQIENKSVPVNISYYVFYYFCCVVFYAELTNRF